jgi:putative oxidoreductase
MKWQLLSSQKLWYMGILIARILTGIIIFKYGLEMFQKVKITDYTQWLTDLHFPAPVFMVYLGKATELIGGAFLALGLFTRLITVPLIINMIVVAFVMGHGNIFADEQLPFLLLLLSVVFLCVGGGRWSLDYFIFGKSKAKPVIT